MTRTRTTDEAVKNVETQIGETLKVRDANWVKLMQEGVIINLHVRRWRAETQLKAADLGITLDKAADELLMRLGSKALMPTNYIQEAKSIDSGARAWLASKTIKTHYGQFCPVTAYQEVKKGLDGFALRYETLRRRIVAEYKWWRVEVEQQYKQLFYQAWDRLEKLGIKNKILTDQDTFVYNMTAAVMKLIPDAEVISQSMAFEIELSYIPLPSLLAGDEAKARRIRTDGAMDIERQNLLAQMNQDVVNKARQQKEELVETFMRDTVATLRNMVFDTCDDVLASIQKNGKLQPRSALQIKNLVEQINQLNFYDDQQVTRMVNVIKTELSRYGGTERGVNSFSSKLKDIAMIARAELFDLGSQPRETRTLGLGSVPSYAELTDARKRTGLDKPIDVQPEFEGLGVVRGKRQL